ncbi:leucine-rich repeat-containing protein 25 [Octodon degus]|uniref:Leucine-rich repeat-containing protein 25 n=1 Tax=Octodon degus TaxID=10160 RepID=A0A6P3FWI0_OCTDE|nr:leucine-rich repeat-containing protein 25 [Octodon degus]
MGTELAWALLLGLLGLQKLSGQEPTCAVFPGDLDWRRVFNDSCLNFSGRTLRLHPDQPLQAPHLRVLDLSGTGLQELSLPFLTSLRQLRVLSVLHNPLDNVDAALGSHCDLELRADCTCALGPWHRAWHDNCSSQEPLHCLHQATGTWRNVSAFLEASCAPSLTLAAIGGVVAGSTLFLTLVVAGSVLAWRHCGHHTAGTQGQGKAWGPQDAARTPSSIQPRYSSRSSGLKAPEARPPRIAAPHYENVFLGQPEEGHQWPDHRTHPPEDSGFYMNYRGPSLDAQPVYGNLQAPAHEDAYEISEH